MNKILASILALLELCFFSRALLAAENKHVFAFRPDTLYGYNFGDTGIAIEMEAKAKVIDSIRVRSYLWKDGHYQMTPTDGGGGAFMTIPDATYLYDLSLTDNIRLNKPRQKIRIRGISPSSACYIQNVKFDVRLRFFAKNDSGEIIVIQEKQDGIGKELRPEIKKP